MPRWLTRLLILGIIAAAALFVVSRLMNQEEDFDEFDDIDAGFEFEETPVEIEVPVEEMAPVAAGMAPAEEPAAPSGASAALATSAPASAPATGPLDNTGETGPAEATAPTEVSQDTIILSIHPEGEGTRLIDVNGIGRTYEARLQSIGINTLEDLAQADPDSLAEQLDVIGGRATVEDWIGQARSMISGESQSASGGQTEQ